jgi:hypothetical protein
VNAAWTQFLLAAEPPDHGARVYTDVTELAESVGVYLAAGLDRGEPAVVIATPAHWGRFAERLAALGWGARELDESGLLWLADADETLVALMVDGRPSPERFEQVVGGLLDRVAERHPAKRARAYGEMVDLLCRRGDPRSAAALEELWNRAARRRAFSLLCGYHLDLFDRATQVSVLPDVCRAHSHMLPAAHPDRLQRAVDAALEEALGADGGKVYALSSGHSRATKGTSPAEAALMWLSAEMPAHAERILASARVHYAQA